MKMIDFLLAMLACVAFCIIGGFLLMKLLMITNEKKILFYVSLVGFSGLLVLQAVLRVIFSTVAPAVLIAIGLIMGFCAVGAATAYRLIVPSNPSNTMFIQLSSTQSIT